jgi:hypothetical protein
MRVFWLAAIFFLQSQLPDQIQPGTVTGRLRSIDGSPASGVRIAAVAVPEAADKSGTSAMFGISATNSDGSYRLEKLPPGRYYIFAGLIDLPSYYPNATALDRATAIVVDAGTTVSGIDFTLARPQGLTVSGRLEIPSTMQFSDSWIVTLFSQTRGPTASPMQSKVQRDGTFHFDRVSPGDYRISANLAGAASAYVKAVDADLLNLILPVVDCNAGVQVSGRIVGTPTAPIQSISLSGARSGCTARTSVQPDGTFIFAAVPEGFYQVQLLPAPLGWSASSMTVEKSDLKGTEITLPEIIIVKGLAVTEDGSAFPGTTRGNPVSIRAVGLRAGGEIRSSIQDDGRFELRVPRGEYRISVPGVPADYYLKSITSGNTDLQRSSLIIRDKALDILLTLGWINPPDSGVRLTGRLNFAATGALPNSEGVLLVSNSGSRNRTVRESTLGTDGSFEFTGVPPGVYNIEMFPDNPAALYGIVVEKTDVTGIEFSLPVLVKVKGGIEWSDSQGVTIPAARPNISVQFTKKEGSRTLAWGALAQSGSFQFYLPEGDYRFSISGIPSDVSLSAVTSGDANIMESGLRVKADADLLNLRVTLRGK